MGDDRLGSGDTICRAASNEAPASISRDAGSVAASEYARHASYHHGLDACSTFRRTSDGTSIARRGWTRLEFSVRQESLHQLACAWHRR